MGAHDVHKLRLNGLCYRRNKSGSCIRRIEKYLGLDCCLKVLQQLGYSFCLQTELLKPPRVCFQIPQGLKLSINQMLM
ncbi:Uncharacterised protein [Mycobacterium tuberculosis]|nr:Uncharacterised protein [Mycobacterium tuberculosis]